MTPYFRRDRRTGFWQLTTVGYIDGDQEARLIELMRNGDGTLSIFSTMVDHAAPSDIPPSGTPASTLGNRQLAAISQYFARVRGFPSTNVQRNQPQQELVLPDPQRYL